MENPLRVFISSVIVGMTEERGAVEAAIQAMPLSRPWRFESSPASSLPLEESYLSQVRQCDIFVLLLKDTISEPVKLEAATADQAGKPRLVFLWEGAPAEVADYARSLDVKYAGFRNAAHLAEQAAEAVSDELITGYRRHNLALGDLGSAVDFRNALAAGRAQIDTGGGALVGGNVDTEGGDFAGRDNIAATGPVATGGSTLSMSEGTTGTGNSNVITAPNSTFVFQQPTAPAPHRASSAHTGRPSYYIWTAGIILFAAAMVVAAILLRRTAAQDVPLASAAATRMAMLPDAPPTLATALAPKSPAIAALHPESPTAAAVATGTAEATLSSATAGRTAPGSTALSTPTLPVPDAAIAAAAARMAPKTIVPGVFVQQVAWSPTGDLLAIASQGAIIYDAQTMAPLRTIRTDGTAGGVAFSPDGKLLAVSSPAGVSLRNPATGGEIRAFGELKNAGRMAFAPDSKTLAVVINDVAKLVDVADGHELNVFVGEIGAPPRSVAFSPDGTILAVAGMTLKLWNPTTGDELRTLRGHGNSITDVAFSPDGSRIATSSIDQTAKVWDVATGHELVTLAGHTGQVDAVTFSSDGKMLATAAWDMTVKLWDVASGQELRTLRGHTRWIGTAAFAPVGLQLASGDAEDLRIWAPR